MAVLMRKQAQAQGDPFAARQLAKGLTLVPYWDRSADGRRIACCVWMRLRPGQSIGDAARALTQRLTQQFVHVGGNIF